MSRRALPNGSRPASADCQNICPTFSAPAVQCASANSTTSYARKRRSRPSGLVRDSDRTTIVFHEDRRLLRSSIRVTNRISYHSKEVRRGEDRSALVTLPQAVGLIACTPTGCSTPSQRRKQFINGQAPNFRSSLLFPWNKVSMISLKVILKRKSFRERDPISELW